MKPVPKSAGLYFGAKIPMRLIRRYARQIAERFKPDQIILFGSYAYGTPHEASDVDLMVIMPCRNELDMAVKITWELPAPFATDLLVRKPQEWLWRTQEGESFSTAILTMGEVLYAGRKRAATACFEKLRPRSPVIPRSAISRGDVGA